MTIIKKLYHTNFIGKFLHTLVNELKRELNDCESVLDLGCGPDSPLQYCENIKYSVGVDNFKPYLEKSKNKKIHNKYYNKRIQDLNFKEKSFDAVILIEVLEHLSKKDAFELIKKAEKWAIKKIIISTPNGFINQKAVDNNPLQKHLSGWGLKELNELGFEIRGLAGLKMLRKEVENDNMGDDLMTSIRFWPKFFWFFIAAVTQVFTFYVPSVSFELFGVKEL